MRLARHSSSSNRIQAKSTRNLCIFCASRFSPELYSVSPCLSGAKRHISSRTPDIGISLLLNNTSSARRINGASNAANPRPAPTRWSHQQSLAQRRDQTPGRQHSGLQRQFIRKLPLDPSQKSQRSGDRANVKRATRDGTQKRETEKRQSDNVKKPSQPRKLAMPVFSSKPLAQEQAGGLDDWGIGEIQDESVVGAENAAPSSDKKSEEKSEAQSVPVSRRRRGFSEESSVEDFEPQESPIRTQERVHSRAFDSRRAMNQRQYQAMPFDALGYLGDASTSGGSQAGEWQHFRPRDRSFKLDSESTRRPSTQELRPDSNVDELFERHRKGRAVYNESRPDAFDFQDDRAHEGQMRLRLPLERDVSGMKCYKCGGIGHMARQCTSTSDQQLGSKNQLEEGRQQAFAQKRPVQRNDSSTHIDPIRSVAAEQSLEQGAVACILCRHRFVRFPELCNC